MKEIDDNVVCLKRYWNSVLSWRSYRGLLSDFDRTFLLDQCEIKMKIVADSLFSHVSARIWWVHVFPQFPLAESPVLLLWGPSLYTLTSRPHFYCAGPHFGPHFTPSLLLCGPSLWPRTCRFPVPVHTSFIAYAIRLLQSI